MKKIIPILLIILCQACLLTRFIKPIGKSNPITSTPQESTPTADSSSADLSSVCRTDVDGIRALLDDLKYPQHLSDGDFTRHPEDFDPNQFFTVLTHLHMQPGYVLDYLAFQDGMGGRPLVYARKVTDQPFPTTDEIFAIQNKITPSPNEYYYSYLAHVQVDGTPASYLEYNLLSTYGVQWYLFWHSNYNDIIFLCDSTDLARIDAAASSYTNGAGLPADVKSRAQKLDFTPTVAVSDAGVVVRFVYFTKWGGFIEEIYTLDPANPYTILNRQTTPLVEYNYGIMF